MSINSNTKPIYKATRARFKWSIPEILRLQREHELLKLPVSEIARRHFRTENAILAKIENENFDKIESLKKTTSDSRNTTSMSLALFVCIPIFFICANYIPIIKDSYPY